MLHRVLLAFVLAFLAIHASAELIEANKDNFNQIVDGSTNVLVKFYAPWCGHCKTLAPEYKLAASAFKEEDDIKIVALDATEAPEIADQFGVQGYPTLKFFPKGNADAPIDYEGERSANDLVNFVNNKVGTSRMIKKMVSPLVVLDNTNFDEVVLGSKHALVKFYAPWCGHCKSMAPDYEALATAFAAEENVVIGKLDATEYPELAQKYSVSGYPTLIYFAADSSEPTPYTSGRALVDFIDFVNEKAGTHISPNGGLLPSAGRLAELDALIHEAGHLVTDALVSRFEAMQESFENSPRAKYFNTYVKTARNVLSKGADYIEKESTRLAKLVQGNLKAEVKAGMLLRQNILRAFLPNKEAHNEEL